MCYEACDAATGDHGFRLVPQSVTLNDLERRNGRVVCVISLHSVTFGLITVRKSGYFLRVKSVASLGGGADRHG